MGDEESAKGVEEVEHDTLVSCLSTLHACCMLCHRNELFCSSLSSSERVGRDGEAVMLSGREQERAAEHEGQCSHVIAHALALCLRPPCLRQASLLFGF